jgi:hypothetical protein
MTRGASAVGRLIQQQQMRLAHQGSCDRHHLLLVTGVQPFRFAETRCTPISLTRIASSGKNYFVIAGPNAQRSACSNEPLRVSALTAMRANVTFFIHHE